MKVKPMIFNSQMVQALLEGRKTQTRRPVPVWQIPKKIKNDSRYMSVAQNHRRWGFGVFGETESACMQNYNDGYSSCCPYASKGDLIYVRETTSAYEPSDSCVVLSKYKADGEPVLYSGCNDDGYTGSWSHWNYPRENRPSIHMPRWASRLTLKVTGVRVERVQDISKEDAESEGFKLPPADGQGWAVGAVSNFRFTWEKIYGDSWKNNDWVWVIDFDVIRKNVDEYINETGASI